MKLAFIFLSLFLISSILKLGYAQNPNAQDGADLLIPLEVVVEDPFGGPTKVKLISTQDSDDLLFYRLNELQKKIPNNSEYFSPNNANFYAQEGKFLRVFENIDQELNKIPDENLFAKSTGTLFLNVCDENSSPNPSKCKSSIVRLENVNPANLARTISEKALTSLLSEIKNTSENGLPATREGIELKRKIAEFSLLLEQFQNENLNAYKSILEKRTHLFQLPFCERVRAEREEKEKNKTLLSQLGIIANFISQIGAPERSPIVKYKEISKSVDNLQKIKSMYAEIESLLNKVNKGIDQAVFKEWSSKRDFFNQKLDFFQKFFQHNQKYYEREILYIDNLIELDNAKKGDPKQCDSTNAEDEHNRRVGPRPDRDEQIPSSGNDTQRN